MSQLLTFTNRVGMALNKALERLNVAPDAFILTDEHTRQAVLPILQTESTAARDARIITIPSGDMNKNLSGLTTVWKSLVSGGATRRSLLINLGGGMVTDLGGFAASTFKRGIRFINVPTTLLGAVDAAVGGKTGVNFEGLKNEIGVFREADEVIISTLFFCTLPREELLSGYGEMLKHGLLRSEEYFKRLMDVNVVLHDFDALLPLLEENVNVKRRIVAEDPMEKGIRKALNLGHTSGHAFESLSMMRGRPIPHGYAVAWGLLVDLILSHFRYRFSSELLHLYASFLKELYGCYQLSCHDYDELLELMRHDKKNATPGAINFTLLKAPGDVIIDCIVSDDEIRQALDIFRDLNN